MEQHRITCEEEGRYVGKYTQTETNIIIIYLAQLVLFNECSE